MTRTSTITTTLIAVVASNAATTRGATYVVGADARPNALGGRVATDAYNDTTKQFDSDVHHFGYILGRSTSDPYLTNDPGFNAVAGSGLPGGEQLRFDVVRHLTRWDGAGTVRFLDVPSSESIKISLGGTSTTIAGASDSVSGFSITNIAANGSFHRHLNALLQGGANNQAAPAPGLYFMCMRLAVTGGSLAHSDALYIAYNNGLADAAFQRGMTYLANPIAGDTNFDSRVNFDDLVTLAQNYTTNIDASFFDGDFDGSRTVTFDDLVALAQHYGEGTTGSSTAPIVSAFGASFAADWERAQQVPTVVPEPISLSLAAFTLLLTRRRRVC